MRSIMLGLALVALGILWLVADAKQPRSDSARHAFARTVPCPSTGKPSLPCPGYIIDHLVPLCWGGADAPSNMQWQTVVDAKKKDVFEVAACALKKKCGI